MGRAEARTLRVAMVFGKSGAAEQEGTGPWGKLWASPIASLSLLLVSVLDWRELPLEVSVLLGLVL